MYSLVVATVRSAGAAWHRLAGAAWFRLGRTERARGHFERVLELRGDDFAAYVYLGRIAYSVGDYAGWRREYEHARRTSPERYARLKHPFELFEPRAAGALREEAGERATWRTVKVPPDGDPMASGNGLEARILRGDVASLFGRGRRGGDDCGSAAERQKFRSLGPIRRAEVVDVDIDDLSRRLGG